MIECPDRIKTGLTGGSSIFASAIAFAPIYVTQKYHTQHTHHIICDRVSNVDAVILNVQPCVPLISDSVAELLRLCLRQHYVSPSSTIKPSQMLLSVSVIPTSTR